MDGRVPAALRADGPGTARVVGSGVERIVGTLAEALADRVDRGKVENIEAHRGHIGELRLHVAERAVAAGFGGGRSGEHLVPRAIAGSLALDEDAQRPVVRPTAPAVGEMGHGDGELGVERRPDAARPDPPGPSKCWRADAASRPRDRGRGRRPAAPARRLPGVHWRRPGPPASSSRGRAARSGSGRPRPRSYTRAGPGIRRGRCRSIGRWDPPPSVARTNRPSPTGDASRPPRAGRGPRRRCPPRPRPPRRRSA